MSKLKIKGAEILNLANEPTNMHQVHLKSRVSWTTVHKYLTGEALKSIDTEALLSILINGLGLTWSQVRELKIGDILEIVD